MTTISQLHAVATKIDSSRPAEDVMFEERFAEQMDRDDPLKEFRNEFHIPTFQHNGQRKEHVYFTGNSLGLQPKLTQTLVNEELVAWQTRGVEGHFTGSRPWLNTDDFVLDEVASLVGAEKDEVVVMNSLTVNLHLFMISFYQPTPHRYKIMIESDAFPSDWYAVVSQIKLRGFDPETALIRLAPRPGEHIIREEDFEARLQAEDGAVALILWPGVQYYTGQLFDMKRLTEAAHRHGATMGLDLAHAVANVPLSLHDWNVDFAAWCHYKYANSGPGAIGGAFVHRRHCGADAPPHRLAGWWGHDLSTRFGMRSPFNGYMFALMERHVQHRYGTSAVQFLTPIDESRRGCQLSMIFGSIDGKTINAKAVFQRLTEQGVVTDFREPGSIRCAPVPLYNTFADVRLFVRCVVDAIAAELQSQLKH